MTESSEYNNDTERETAEAAVNLYQSLEAITCGGSLSDEVVADILENYAEELR